MGARWSAHAGTQREQVEQCSSPTGTSVYYVLMRGGVECAASYTERADQTTSPAGTSVYSVSMGGVG